MRAELRKEADEIWVIDCSPEGHQPEVATRVFQDVQQPVCIVMALRRQDERSRDAARVRYRVLKAGHRNEKFAELRAIALDDDGWAECLSDGRASFLPRAVGAWRDYPALDELFSYDGAGVMPGRTWVIAPDRESLSDRWDVLTSEPDMGKKEALFHPHLSGDRHINKSLSRGLYGHEYRGERVAADTKPVIRPEPYAFRSFDRQWIIPDARVINRPNPMLWEIHSRQQVYMTALHRTAPTGGPGVTFSGNVPDLDHYHGRGGRVFPLWADRKHTIPNVKAGFLDEVGAALGTKVAGSDALAYVAGIAAHPAYTAHFQGDLVQPGLRFPLTTDLESFEEAVEIGREVIWLHCFGARFADSSAGRPSGPPRLPKGERPVIPKAGAISGKPADYPQRIAYDAAKCRLEIGGGFIENVRPTMWSYEVSGKQVLVQWFSNRRRDRSKPIIGTRREPSRLHWIQPESWPAEYTSELINVLNVLGRLVALEKRQEDLLRRVCGGALLSADELRANGAFDGGVGVVRAPQDARQRRFFDEKQD